MLKLSTIRICPKLNEVLFVCLHVAASRSAELGHLKYSTQSEFDNFIGLSPIFFWRTIISKPSPLLTRLVLPGNTHQI